MSADRPPYFATMVITGVLIALVVYLVAKGGYDGLVGTVVGLVAGYWLPTRPNREPPH